jgi:hypothetical protein
LGSGYTVTYSNPDTNQYFSRKFDHYLLEQPGHGQYEIIYFYTDSMFVTGSPAPTTGTSYVRAKNPQYMLAICEFQDSSNGGYGYTKLYFAADGTTFETLLDTEVGYNTLGVAVPVANPGGSYRMKLVLKNDSQGRGPVVQSAAVFTDPSVWGY